MEIRDSVSLVKDTVEERGKNCPCDDIVGSCLYVGSEIASGSHGSVKLIRTSGTSPYLAAKYCQLGGDGVKNLLEPSIMRSHKHPYINHAHRVIRKDSSLILIQDHAISDLQQFHVINPVDMVRSRRWCQNLALAVAYLHSHQIIHCDIKAANVLLFQDNSIKLTDFSISVKKWKSDETFTRSACTCTHRPPECLLGERWDERIDIWALGCTFYELMMGISLFRPGNKEDLLPAIAEWNDLAAGNATGPRVHLNIPSDYYMDELCQFRDLLAWMLTGPKERYSIQQVLSHPWINQEGKGEDILEAKKVPCRVIPSGIVETLKGLCIKYSLPIHEEAIGTAHAIWKESIQVPEKKRLLGAYWISLKLRRLNKGIELDTSVAKLLSKSEHAVANSMGYALGV
jgi:serine/threonine protein kinase